MKGSIGHLPRIESIFLEEIDLGLAFETIGARFANDPGTVLLLSGSSPDSLNADTSRFNILGVHPWLELKGRQEALELIYQGKSISLNQDPFSLVQELLDHFSLDESLLPGRDLPLYSGMMGYLAYDLKDRIESLPRTCVDTHLPDICLYCPSVILIQDCQAKKSFLCIPILFPNPSDKETYIQNQKQAFLDQVYQEFESLSPCFSIDSRGFKSSFTKSEYIQSVEKIIQYLKDGEIYQANLSQRFETSFTGDAYALFLELFQRNPASFFSFIHAKDHKILSTSPERFVKLNQNQVETRPIKGTIARGRTPDQDRENSRLLGSSIKDDAELTMIVDLMRNDLSRVTKPGSVVVAEHKRLEPYENVFHLVSIVQGELEDSKTAVDLLRATFPGGSITGCPKIRSMEIIDELEPIKRHVYTGSIGYISFHKTMDLSIAIRTATLVGQSLFFSVGGGIVYDSDPEKEFQETLDKGKTLLETLSRGSSKKEIPCLRAWVDGKLVDQDQAMISAQSPGFQYGAGVFETLRVEKGIPLRLKAHVQRMNRAWTALFHSKPPDITWESVIQQLIRENHFQEKTCALKLILARDDQPNGKKVFQAAFVRPYVHRLDLIGKPGLDLVTYPHPRQTPLAAHKTLNYLYYDRAGQYAGAKGGDEALILNPDHTISETNTCNVLVIKGREIILPASDHVLPGVTLAALLKGLESREYTIVRKKIGSREFSAYPNILLTNALMGVVRVFHIDGQPINHDKGVWEEMKGLLPKE